MCAQMVEASLLLNRSRNDALVSKVMRDQRSND